MTCNLALMHIEIELVGERQIEGRLGCLMVSMVLFRGMDTAAKSCPRLVRCMLVASLHAFLHPTSTATSIKCGN